MPSTNLKITNTWQPDSPRRRSSRRQQVARALWFGLLVQATATGMGLAALQAPLAALRDPLIERLAFISALLLPCWAAGWVIGCRAPGFRWWQLASLGLLGAGVFLLFPLGRRSLPLLLHGWLVFNLVIGPVITGYLGHWWRLWQARAYPSLEPRPWVQ